MKKILLVLMAGCLSAGTSPGQTGMPPAAEASFCGRTDSGGPGGGRYTVAELKACNLEIIPTDTALHITGFRMTLIATRQQYDYAEVEVEGNRIPEKYRRRILEDTRYVYLEYIKATGPAGREVDIKPIAVRINR